MDKRVLDGAVSSLRSLTTQRNEKPLALRQENRREWLNGIVNRWQAASGVKFDPDRLAVVAAELDMVGYTEKQAMAAEAWIVFGGPCAYGSLTLRDFFPTKEQLAEVGVEACTECNQKWKSGYTAGYAQGRIDEGIAVAENDEFIRESTEGVDLVLLRIELDSREKSLAEWEGKLTAREEAITKPERVARVRARFFDDEVVG
jgi:hypothetical protein